MPLLPQQIAINEISLEATSFGGYRHDHRAGPDRFYDMKNMSSDAFPLLTSRKKRKPIETLTNSANGVCAIGALCRVDGTSFKYGTDPAVTVEDSAKQFAVMGSKIIIWPDKKVYDTVAKTLTPLGASVTTSDTVTITHCEADGAALGATPTVSATKPENATNGAYWIDTSNTPHVLKKFSTNTGRWTSIETTYIKIAATGIGADFAEGDGVAISGCSTASLNASYIIKARAADYIVVVAIIDATITQAAAMTVSRSIPDLDYICELNNRIWGCSSSTHEIRCCKLGDPTNWNCYAGISTDSYALTIGSPGDFTGCCAYGGNVLFFKSNLILKILGVKPSQFTLSPVECNGVAPGSAGSLVVANERLYYNSTAGICEYSGSTPMLIGEDLGEIYRNAVAGATPTKYYVSMQDSDDAWHLFAYDTAHGLWHREDDSHAIGFARIGAQLYMLNAGKSILAIDDESDTSVADIDWMLETGELIQSGYVYPKQLTIRLSMEFGANVRVLASYDDAAFIDLQYATARRKQPRTIICSLRRCDSFRLRLEGRGHAVIHSISLMMEDGGKHGQH